MIRVVAPCVIIVALTACSSKKQDTDPELVANEHFFACVYRDRDHGRDMAKKEKTSPAEAEAVISGCQQELLIAAAVQSKKRIARGEYRSTPEQTVYKEWRGILHDVALCGLSAEAQQERCPRTD
jgi:hypothetical protein